MTSITTLRRAIAITLAVAGLAAAATIAPPDSSPQTPLNPPPNGPRMVEPSVHALVGGVVHVSPTQTLENGAVVIRNGSIERVVGALELKDWAPPGDARVWDCKGLHIYAGFIDAFVEVDAPSPTPDQPGVHWNAAVTPQRSVLDGDRLPESTAEGLRKLGFTAAGLSPRAGLFRGKGAVVSLAKPADQLSQARSPVYVADAFHAMSFETGTGRRRGGPPGATPAPRPADENSRWSGYPGSQMGSIALIRQTFLDATWPGTNGAVNALTPLAATDKPAPIFFDVGDELDSLRAAKIGREFKRPMVLVGSGNEFRRLDAIKADALAQIIPLAYPKKPDVSSVAKAEAVELRELMTWEQAPLNLKRLDDAGLKVAITSAKLPRGQNFQDNLKEAVKAGLKPERALAMLTTNPAEILGISGRAGTIEKGKLANLVVTDADLFKDPGGGDKSEDKKDDAKKDEAKKDEPKKDDDKKDDAKGDDKKQAKIRDVWVDGQRHEINAAPGLKLEGEWALTIPGAAPVSRSLVFDKDNAVTVKRDGKTVKATSSSLNENRLSFVFDHEPLDGVKGLYTASGVVIGDTITGSGIRSSGETYTWSATKTQAKDNPLAGDWVVVEADGKPVRPDAPSTPKVTIAKDNTVTVKVGDKSTQGKEPLASGDTISYTYDNAEFGGEGQVSDMLTLKDGVLEGVSKFPGNVTHAFKMQKEGKETKPKGLSDSWVVVEIDGQAVNDAKDPEATVVKIKVPDRREARAQGGAGRGEADKAEKAPDKNADPSATGATVSLTTVADTEKDAAADNIKIDGDKVEYTLDMAKLGGQGLVSVQATRSGDELKGQMTIPTGQTKGFRAVRLPDFDRRYWGMPKAVGYPFGPYAMERVPDQGPVALRNATVWTSGPAGIIQNGAVVLDAGKVVWVGKNAEADAQIARLKDAKTIDCSGKHISPGIIDCHSHTGISRGVNEGGQAVTSEVRIQDVTNPDSISWYRQLGGGVTAVNNLHGSANPIGGQNCVNKVRWGVQHPDEMHLDGRDSYSDDNPFAAGARRSTTMPGIKFALGENVKQSNGFNATTRYPATRMGVDTMMRDRFTAAKEYVKSWKDYATKASGDAAPPRRDLELEALGEILEGLRLIHCHSYRQDEILALAIVAKEFGFKLGSYQHNLEGYKVAEAVKESARGASLFSDWWAYKVEVQDAIPQAGPIMHDVGVAVSYNSDSDELARRLGPEAGKAVKYGGVDPAEALKFVTLNPAIQLGIESRVGSLEAGKDADVAVWSGSPISSLSRCEMTFVDGRLMFSLEMDKAAREEIRHERQRIVQKILSGGKRSSSGSMGEMAAGPGGGRGRPGGGGRRPTDELDESFDELTSGRPLGLLERMQWDARKSHYLEMLRKGQDPRFAKCGDCGELYGQ